MPEGGRACSDVFEGLAEDDQHSDVIVIGTGACGGTLAHRLAGTGKQVLLR